MNTHKHGIDYGLGQTNVDKTTGIHFGVIPHHDVCQSWADASEPDYGPPTCPKCGNQADKLSAFGETFASGIPDDYETGLGFVDYVCVDCKYVFDASEAFGDDPLAFTYIEDGYSCEQNGGDSDIFVTKSPYYTHAQFCSPCAPGACYLLSSTDTSGPRTYCFGHDWFEGGSAPYPVYSVETGELVLPSV